MSTIKTILHDEDIEGLIKIGAPADEYNGEAAPTAARGLSQAAGRNTQAESYPWPRPRRCESGRFTGWVCGPGGTPAVCLFHSPARSTSR
jgi:hypothetical protein